MSFMAGRTKSISARARKARSVRRIRHANQQLVISSVRQHELTDTAEKLNDELRAEIVRRQHAADALTLSNAEVAAELAGSQRLQQISSLLVQGGDIDALYRQILQTAIALMSSDMGSLQKLYPERGDLCLLAWEGFDPQSAAFWEWVRPASTSTCGMALRSKERVTVPDTETCDFMAGTEDLDACRKSGIRAVQSTPLISRHGNIVGMISTHWRDPHQPGERDIRLLDVLARQAADLIERAETEQARAKLAAIVQSSDDAIISKDLNGTITSWNRGAERLFGYTAAEAIGRSVTILMPPDRMDEEPGILARIRRGESVEHYETVRQCKNGVRLDVSITVSPIKDDQGRVIGASKIARDITHRKRTEESLREAQAQLADRAGQLEQAVAERTAELTATNSQLEAFIYSVAHDLRAPLRSMQGFSSVLVEEAGQALSKTGQNYAQRINQSAQFMDAMLIDMLAFSRISQQSLQLVPVSLHAAVTSVLSRLESDIQEKNARIDAPGPWPTVLAHQAVLEQVLFNLVSNALKFVSPGTPPQIRLRAESIPNPQPSTINHQLVRVWSEDNGIGIAPAHQTQIFRLFNRLHGDKYPGTGLGLAIVQKGIERMGGRVGVQSTRGQGSRFWIELRRPTEPQ